MGSRSGSAGVSVKVKGLKELDAFMRDQIAAEDLGTARKALRQGTKKIATDVLIPALKTSAAASGVPTAPAMAATARTRTDRIVTVRIGTVNPKLSGFKRGIGQGKAKAATSSTGRVGSKTSQGYRTGLAYGSDRGPHPLSPHNRYGVPRNEAGYWVGPAITKAFTDVRSAYMQLLDDLLRDYGRYR